MTKSNKKKLSELNLTDKFLFDETTEDPACYEALGMTTTSYTIRRCRNKTLEI